MGMAENQNLIKQPNFTTLEQRLPEMGCTGNSVALFAEAVN
jgi:hypothetical protein